MPRSWNSDHRVAPRSRLGFRGAGLAISLAIATSRGALAAACPELGSWLNVKTQPSPASLADKIRSIKEEWEARKTAAAAVYDSYRSGRLDAQTLESCLEAQPERQNFLNSLYESFFERTLDELSRSREPGIQALAHALS